MRDRLPCKVAAYTLVLIGCVAATAAAAPPIVIEYWHQPRVRHIPGMVDQTKEFGDYERILAQEFMEQNPGIEIRTQCLNWEDLPRKVPIAIMAGSPPDILQDFSGRTSGYWYQGVLEPLDDVVTDLSDKFRADWLASNRIDGKLHSVPLFGGAQVLAINRALWKQAGKLDLLPPAEKPFWTAQQFEAAIKAIAVPGKIYPLALQAASEQGDYAILQFFWSNGAKIYDNQDYSRVLLNSPLAVQSLQWLVAAHKDGLLPPNITALGGAELSDLFLRGGAGCIPSGATIEHTLATADADGRLRVEMDLMFAMPPTPVGERPQLVKMTGGLIVFKQKTDEKRTAVFKFVRFLTQVKSLIGYSTGARMTVVNKNVPSPFIHTKYGKILPYVDAAESVDMGVMSPHYYAIRRLLPPHLQAAFLGQKTPQQALDDFCREAHAIVRQTEEANERAALGKARSSPPLPLTLSFVGAVAIAIWIFRRQLLAS